MGRRILLVIFILTGVAGCTRVLNGLCIARGGVPDGDLGGYRFCGHKFKDAGTVCYHSSDCEGDCILPWDWDPKNGYKVIGQCQANSTYEGTYGCLPIERSQHQSACIEE